MDLTKEILVSVIQQQLTYNCMTAKLWNYDFPSLSVYTACQSTTTHSRLNLSLKTQQLNIYCMDCHESLLRHLCFHQDYL